MSATALPHARLTMHTLPSLLAVALFALLLGAGSLACDGFFSGQVFLNPFIDNAFPAVVALGLSFVILGRRHRPDAWARCWRCRSCCWPRGWSG